MIDLPNSISILKIFNPVNLSLYHSPSDVHLYPDLHDNLGSSFSQVRGTDVDHVADKFLKKRDHMKKTRFRINLASSSI